MIFVCNCVCMSTRRSSLPSEPSALTARVPGGNVTSSSQPTNAKVRHVIETKTIHVNFCSSLRFMYKFAVFLFQDYIYIKPTLVSSHGWPPSGYVWCGVVTDDLTKKQAGALN